MRDLIARIEAATGPDRNLDMEICIAVGRMHEGLSDHAKWLWVCSDAGRFTASLDAAVSLVPAGWGWHVDTLPPQTPWASLVWSGQMRHDAHAATPALALCAAALRARMQEATDA